MFRQFRSRIGYSNVAATLALVLALGGGVVYAASKPKPTVKLSQLKFPLEGKGTWTDSPIAGTSTFQTVLSTTYTVNGKHGNMLAQTLVEVDDSANNKGANVTLRMVMDGEVEEGVYTTTVPALGDDSVLAQFSCDESPGIHTVEIQAMSDGVDPVTLEDRSLNVQLLPE